MKKRFLPLLVAFLITTGAVAQQNMLYNHYYLNPFLYNPSYIAPTGYSELYLNYRKQWSGIDGAPETGTMNFQLPLNHKSGLAFTAIQDKAGLLKTTTGLVSFSYTIHFGKSITDINHFSFGLSAGVTNSRIVVDEADNIQDPVIGNNTTSLDGQFGVNYRYNNFRIGFAIPRIFDTRVVSEDNFTQPGIAQLDNTISSISYEFKLGDKFSVEPMATYRTYQGLDPFFEGLATLRIAEVAWVGGAYRQNYGAFGFFGLNVKQKLRVAYSYEFATDQTDKMGSGSHEVQIAYRLGKKQHTKPQKVSPHTTTPQPAPIAEETKPTVAPAVAPAVVVVPEKKPTQQIPAPTPKVETPVDNATPAPPPPKVVNLQGEGLAPGHYVVVGAFESGQNALTYMRTLTRAGYPAQVGYDPHKKFYYVHMNEPSQDMESARKMRDKYRQISRYTLRDTWILSIE
jgi:type IX secretion system PorP/SprF family membrane protein